MITAILFTSVGFYAGVYASDKQNIKFDTIAKPFVKGYEFVSKKTKELMSDKEQVEKPNNN